MPTQWFYPSQITQYAEATQHLSWQGTGADFTSMKQIRTQIELTTIASDLRLDNIRTKTYYLLLQGWNIPSTAVPYPLNGIELYVNVRRGGRITDETIALWYNNDVVSNNRAQGDLGDIQTYGGEGDLWDAVPMISTLLASSQFGIILRYQSNVNWPHKTAPMMQHVQLRFW
mgnify:CR=1 FL=1